MIRRLILESRMELTGSEILATDVRHDEYRDICWK